MATGDITISVAVEGGVTKNIVLDSATRQKIILNDTGVISFADDAAWQVFEVNQWAAALVLRANKQLESELTYTRKTFTAAT